MNQDFAEVTTSVAFCLQLSKRQCNSLLRLADGIEPLDRMYVISVDGLSGLKRKGLVFWHQDADGRSNGFGGMTEAGKLTASLLKEAGLSVENTNTALVLKRLDRMGMRAAA